MTLQGAEIAVIGAGALGLCAAAELARRGARVVVFDPGGRNASTIAAGMLAPAFEAALEDAPRRTADLYRSARDRWPGFAEAFGLALNRDGAEWRGDAGALLGRMHGAGFTAEPTPEGLFTPEDWSVDPLDATARLRRALDQAGAARLHVRAERLRLDHGRVRVDAGARSWTGDAVVLATGWSAAGLDAPDLRPLLERVSPIKGQIARLEGPGAASVRRVVRAPGVYVVPRGGGVLVGATMEPGRADETVDPHRIEALRSAAVAAVPELADAAVAEAWAGVRGASPDGLPMIGRTVTPGVFAALGPRRNGWLFAPLAAEILCDLIAEKDPGGEAGVLRPDRFDELTAG